MLNDSVLLFALLGIAILVGFAVRDFRRALKAFTPEEKEKDE